MAFLNRVMDYPGNKNFPMLLPKQNLKSAKENLPKLDNRLQGRLFKGDFSLNSMYDSAMDLTATSGNDFTSKIPVKTVGRI